MADDDTAARARGAAALENPEVQAVLEEPASGAAACTVWEWEDDLLYALPARTVRKCARLGCANTEAIPGAVAAPADGVAALSLGESGAPEAEASSKKRFASCARCGARFCCRECQVADWRKNSGSHRRMCPQLAALRDGGFSAAQKRDAALRGCLGRVRMYAFPFYVGRRASKGAGALFLQSKNTLDEFFFDGPVGPRGEPANRTIFASFVTPQEFDAELVAEDFELALARRGFNAGVASAAEDESRACILCKFRCGYVCVFTTQIVPDVAVCNALASDYDDQAILQLNIDDGQ